uniref:Uncharacterized protein n=1 Tax=Oryza meridionalis TaxID=40149 RepID=A0A0E0E602_9ORYZ
MVASLSARPKRNQSASVSSSQFASLLPREASPNRRARATPPILIAPSALPPAPRPRRNSHSLRLASLLRDLEELASTN